MNQIVVTTCPSCGSKRIRRVRRDVESRRHDEVFVARGIEVEECPDCGEQLFSPEALDVIAVQREQVHKQPRHRKSA